MGLIQLVQPGAATPKAVAFDEWVNTNKADTTATTLSAAVSAGATSLSVASTTGFSAGQRVWLSSGSGPNYEAVTIASISGTTLTLTAGTQHAYAVGDTVARTTASVSTVKNTLRLGWANAAQAITWLTTSTSANSYTPTIAIDSAGTAHVVFYSTIYNASYDNIGYVTVTSSGTVSAITWLTTSTNANSTVPAIAIDSAGTAHVVFHSTIYNASYYNIGYLVPTVSGFGMTANGRATGTASASTATVTVTRAASIASTLSAVASAGATSISVTSAIGIAQGDTLELDPGTASGERLTVTGAPSGNTVPVSALANAHNSGAVVNRVDAVPQLSLGTSGGTETWVTPTWASTTESTAFPGAYTDTYHATGLNGNYLVPGIEFIVHNQTVGANMQAAVLEYGAAVA